MTTITAAVSREKSAPLNIETLELEAPRGDEIRVRIVGCGVCHTDMVVRDQGYDVPLPLVLGHEGAGIVDAVGDEVTHVAPGDPVVLSYGHCGGCDNCRSGRPGYCQTFYEHNFHGARLDGSQCLRDANADPVGSMFFSQSSFASYALVTARNVVPIDRDVPVGLMGPLGCGIQTGAGAVLNSLAPPAGSRIAIFGAGSVGLSAVMAAAACGCTTIIAVDLHDSRLALARELGATHVVDPAKDNPVEAIQATTDGGADYSLECTGRPDVLSQAVAALRIPGTCGLIGAADLGVAASLDMNTLLFGRTVQGIIEGDSVPQAFIPRLIELWRHGRFPFHRLVRFYPLEDINQAIADSESGDVLKPIVVPDPADLEALQAQPFDRS